MTWLFDSHIHLSDPAYDSDMKFILNSMEKLSIKACCVSMDVTTSKKTLEIANQNDLVLPFIGVHPEHAQNSAEDVITLIKNNIDKISGIGEIGLDRTYVGNEKDFQTQKHVFQEHLLLAEKFQKPISIHSRKTLDDIYEIIPSYSLKGKLLHWFDGNKKQLTKAMDLGFFVSYGPVMVYANDKQVLLSKTHLDKILVETDGPVRFSRCFANKSAQISMIPSVVFCGAKVLQKTYDEFSAILEKNSNTFLGK